MPLNKMPPFSCPVPDIGPRDVRLLLPGGGQIGAMFPQLYATEAEIARGLLGQVQLVLAPLAPLFDIIAAVLAIKRILDAVPGVITNPGKLIEELKNAAKNFVELAKLIPQISMPIVLGHVIDLLIMVMKGFLTEIERIAVKESDIVALEAEILNDNDPLREVVACARRINKMRLCAVSEAMAPLDPILTLINLFLQVIGLGPIPPLEVLAADVFGARTQLMRVITLLEDARRLIPQIPQLKMTPRC